MDDLRVHELDAETQFKLFMGDYTDRNCGDIYFNVYYNCDTRRLTAYDRDMLNTIYTRSGNISRNPYIFKFIKNTK